MAPSDTKSGTGATPYVAANPEAHKVKSYPWFTPARGRMLGIIAYCLVGFGIVAGGLIHLYGPHATVPADYVEPE